MSVQVSVIVPTLDEAENIAPMVRALEVALGSDGWEVIFVDDDSADGTAEIAKDMARIDPRVRCIHRMGRRGLAGACIEGGLSSSAAYIVVMDGDLQHDESILPRMLAELKDGSAELVIATRERAQSDEVFSPWRARASRMATSLTNRLLGTSVSDPMSGYFAIERKIFNSVAPLLAPTGFKILLDILTSAPRPLKVREVTYSFRTRTAGESKFDPRAVVDFLGLLLHKASGGVLPHRFVLFGLVGATGVIVHMSTLRTALQFFSVEFGTAQTVATVVAMTSNFALNNVLTYRDRILRGSAAISGLLRFYAVCAVGAIANVALAQWVYGWDPVWWLAGLSGIIAGSAFNYGMSEQFVWRNRSSVQSGSSAPENHSLPYNRS